MGERSLIVNADDFGMSEAVNAGIVRAYEDGIVTSTSLMVRGSAVEAAAAYAHEHSSLSVGLHLDLGEWRYGGGAWPAVYEVVALDDPEAVETEVRAQLDACRRLLGRDPTHIDSHQHIHVKEPVVQAVARRLAEELSVPLRQGDSRVRYCGKFYGQSTEGWPYPEAITVEHLIGLIEGLEPGVTELACHPGEGGPAGYDAERRVELETLCDPRVRAAVERAGLGLLSFADALGPEPSRMSHPCDAVYATIPDWALPGSISLPDARFLFDRVAASGASTLVEIGTAAGASAGILCHALDAARGSGGIDSDRRVISYDLRSVFHRDTTKPIGSAVHEMLRPELVRRIEFRHPATAMTLREHHQANELAMLFIDADHRHPSPALDLLATLDLLRPGAEVILHDINLPVIAPQHADWGAKYVYDELSVKKYADLTQDPPNVGSMIIPEDKESVREQLVAIIGAHEWQAEVPDELQAQLL